MSTSVKFGSYPDDPAVNIPEGFVAAVKFPVLCELDTWTSDGRLIDAESFSVRDLPLSIMVKTTTSPGHDGAVVAGRLDYVVVEDNKPAGYGWLLDDVNGRNTARLVKVKALRGNSVDLTAESVEYEEVYDDDGQIIDLKSRFMGAKIGSTTIVGMPAFEGATIELLSDFDLGGLEAGEEAQPIAASTSGSQFAFSVIDQIIESAELFSDPQLDRPTPLQITADGQVYGHIATWKSRLNFTGRTPPRSRTNYAYFRLHEVLTDAGPVATGALVLGADHALRSLNWAEATDHYAATSRAWADVACGEDEHGIWVAGRVRPGTSPEVVVAARASAPSGDWRPVGAGLELVAVLNVNTPGFANPRVFTVKGRTTAMFGLNPVVPIQSGSNAQPDTKFQQVLLQDMAARLLERFK